MSDFEQKYYEYSGFWEEGVLEDKENLQRIDSTINLLPKDVRSVLDAGCGNGVFLNTLLQRRPYLDLHGFDRSTDALQHVKVPRTIGDVTNIRIPDRTYDCVSCLEVIEHIPYPYYKTALSELARVAKKYLLISVPYNEDLLEASNQCPACKSRFNANLHFRSYDVKTFINSFSEFGFTCKEYKLEGPKRIYKFHKQYVKLFYPSQLRQWKAPICVVCGYEEKPSLSKGETNLPVPLEELQLQERSFKTMVTAIPKLLWPKETKYYWIIGIFERTGK